ncbi:molybdenum cofactor guanylyltransferase [Sporosarcina cascadiensis]|uniref:molybdenum cofactor guanylyltransferase n=1 Tax=Sporosarcina cascadiensis TaxID=2660747 RepID=UPI00129B6846|nr:molybdenum cofactor guanylyltransferase [Sporosarcina cascadiensis]
MRVHSAGERGMKQTAGILLAGGQSRRFGSPKAFADYQGQPFYQYSLQALQPFCEEIVVVTRSEFLEKLPNEIHLTTDLERYAGMGPLAGILSGMEAVEAERYAVLPCDMPFMEEQVIGRLLNKHQGDVSAVTVEGKRHPLVSVWQAAAKPAIRQALNEGNRRVMHAQAQLGGQWIEGGLLTEQPELVFKNVNTPCELERR